MSMFNHSNSLLITETKTWIVLCDLGIYALTDGSSNFKCIALRLMTRAHVLLICILLPAPNPHLSVWCRSYLTLWNRSEVMKLRDLLIIEEEESAFFFSEKEFCQANEHARTSIQLLSFLTVHHKRLAERKWMCMIAIVMGIAGFSLFYIQMKLQAHFHQVLKMHIDYAFANMADYIHSPVTSYQFSLINTKVRSKSMASRHCSL